MTPEDIALLRESLDEVRAVGPEAARAFYAELFRLDPSVAGLYRGPLEHQFVIFFHELDVLLSAVTDLRSFVARSRRLGDLHAGRGVRPEHFHSAALALEAMLRAVYGAALSPDVTRAWRTAYAMAAQVMQEQLYA